MKITKFLALICAMATLFVGCEGNGGDENSATGNAVLTADKDVAVMGEPITFTVTSEGADVTAEAKIYNKATYKEVSNPFVSDVDGKYEFYAVYGTSITKSIEISVVPSIPVLPEDEEPTNTTFNHRILLVDHTGTKCGYCPQMMAALRKVAADDNYHDKFYEAMAHTYNSDDPSWSRSAEVVTSHYGSLINGYPSLTFNFYHPIPGERNDKSIKLQIDALWKADGADAGVMAAATGGNTMVAVKAQVKAKVAGDYRVTAWLLEDNIYAQQAGTTDESYYTHNNSIRHIAISNPITGFDLGTIEAGATAEKEMALEIQSLKWANENLKVMVIATVYNSSTKNYDVANIAICPINGSVKYDYKK
ncbi:MAG: Omp28-related outer membrane protein [Alistipes sp.]|nr:Omp28-related outer membrane protein [Alistipes sp.]